jgi:hypothetical protein
MTPYCYKGLTLDSGLELVKQLPKGTGSLQAPIPISDSNLIHIVGRGEDTSAAAIATLRQGIEEILAPVRLSRPISESDFDARASAVIFEALKDLPVELLLDLDFWRYLAVVEIPDIVAWRWPKESVEKFGLSSNKYRSMPFSLFLRGQLANGSSAKELAVLNSINDVDIWASHVWAVLLGSTKGMVIAFLRTCASLQSDTGQFSKANRLVVRALARRLTSVRSNVVFDLSDQRSLDDIVETQLGIVRAKLAQSENQAS